MEELSFQRICLFEKYETRAVVVARLVTHQTMDREVPGSIPTGSWFISLYFFLPLLFSSVNQWCVLDQVPSKVATLLGLSNLAVQLEAKQP